MTWIDWTLLGCVLFSVVLGLLRGLVREVVALIGWVVAIVLAQRFAGQVGALLPVSIQWPAVRTGLGAVLIVVGVVLISALLGWLLKKLMAAVNLSTLDRMLGAGFGLLRAALILLAAVFFTHNTALARQAWWQESVLLPRTEAAARWLVPHLPYVANESSALIPPTPASAPTRKTNTAPASSPSPSPSLLIR